eukprot:3319087-Prymnesium_polylepis.1
MGEPRARWASARWANEPSAGATHAPHGRATARRGSHSHSTLAAAGRYHSRMLSFERYPHKPRRLDAGGG